MSGYVNSQRILQSCRSTHSWAQERCQ